MKPLEFLEKQGIHTDSILAAIQDVRAIVESAAEPTTMVQQIVMGLTNERFEFLETGNTYARLMCQYFVRRIIQDPHRDANSALELSQLDAVHFIKNNKWIYAGSDADKSIRPEQIKEKRLTLYDQAYAFIDEHRTLTNKQIVEHFVKQLGMTKTGAQSYSHNIRSKLGMIQK
jgi:hypothetical protein